MPKKTFLPNLTEEAFDLYRYMTRWQANIMENSLTSEQIAGFVACLECVTTLIELFPRQPGTDPAP